MSSERKERGGFMGKILRVDLTKEKVHDEVIDPKIRRKYVGGLGLAAKIMCDELSPKTMPFDAESRLIFLTGPLTGTPTPGGCRYVVYTLNSFNPKFCSPGFGGGFWATELKRSGYDGIIVKGQSKKPVFLWVHDSKVEIRDAAPVWGKDTHETEDMLQDQIGPKACVASIGPAGENVVRGSVISNDKRHIAAKAGDVMGSKKLKAIVVGSGERISVPVADPEWARKIALTWRENLLKSASNRRKDAGNLRSWGKPEFFGDRSPWILWVKNLSDPAFAYEYGKGIWGVAEVSKIKPIPCFNCNIGCSYDCEIGSGPYKGKIVTLTGGAENYEGFAGNVGVSEGGTILYLTDLLDRWGVDARVGQAIALAYEAYEKGLLTKEDTEGLDLKWGNAEAAVELLKKIIKKEGIGEILEKGPKEAAKILSEKTGKDLKPLSTDIKNCPVISHDYRWSWQKTLSQAVGSFGPVSQGGNLDYGIEPDLGVTKPVKLFDPETAPQWVRISMIKKVFEDSLGVCWFNSTAVPGIMTMQPEMLSAVVGWDFTREEAELVGERIINLGRVFSMRRGLTAADDLDIGPRILEAPSAGLGKGHTPAPYIKKMVQDYYAVMGWDREKGKPTNAVLEKLGLSDLKE
jgi:aldehyde:ferredoxin oxidoreductase